MHGPSQNSLYTRALPETHFQPAPSKLDLRCHANSGKHTDFQFAQNIELPTKTISEKHQSSCQNSESSGNSEDNSGSDGRHLHFEQNYGRNRAVEYDWSDLKKTGKPPAFSINSGAFEIRPKSYQFENESFQGASKSEFQKQPVNDFEPYQKTQGAPQPTAYQQPIQAYPSAYLLSNTGYIVPLSQNFLYQPQIIPIVPNSGQVSNNLSSNYPIPVLVPSNLFPGFWTNINNYNHLGSTVLRPQSLATATPNPPCDVPDVNPLCCPIPTRKSISPSLSCKGGENSVNNAPQENAFEILSTVKSPEIPEKTADQKFKILQEKSLQGLVMLPLQNEPPRLICPKPIGITVKKVGKAKTRGRFDEFLNSPQQLKSAVDNFNRCLQFGWAELKDINGEPVVYRKRGPVSKTDPPRPNPKDLLQKNFWGRNSARAFVSEDDIRLLIFYCTFRKAGPHPQKVALFQAIGSMLQTRWSRKIIGYMNKLQTLVIKKNEQKQKKGFKLVMTYLDENYPRLAETARKLSTHIPKKNEEKRPVLKIKKIKKRKSVLQKRSSRKSKNEVSVDDDASDEVTEKIEVNYNIRTYHNWSENEELSSKMLEALEYFKDPQKIIDVLVEDMFGEIQSLINFYQKETATIVPKAAEDSEIPYYFAGMEMLASLNFEVPENYLVENAACFFPRNLPSSYVDARYTRLEQSKDKHQREEKEATWKHPWTFHSLLEAVEHCDNLIKSLLGRENEKDANRLTSEYASKTVKDFIDISEKAGLLETPMAQVLSAEIEKGTRLNINQLSGN